MPDMGSEPRHLRDLPEHVDSLQIPTIEPPEVRRPSLDRLPIDELHHRFHPPWIRKLIEPALIGLLDSMTAEEALQGVAALAHRAGDFGELRAGDTGDRRDPPGVTRHLRRTG